MFKKIIICAIIVFLISCKNEKKEVVLEIKNSEKFNDFVNKFSNDSIFQKNRIKFPIPIDTYNVENFKYEKTTTQKEEWLYERIINLNDKNVKNEVKYKSDNDVIFLYTIEDSGIHIEYIFKIFNNKWYLSSIKDSST